MKIFRKKYYEKRGIYYSGPQSLAILSASVRVGLPLPAIGILSTWILGDDVTRIDNVVLAPKNAKSPTLDHLHAIVGLRHPFVVSLALF